MPYKFIVMNAPEMMVDSFFLIAEFDDKLRYATVGEEGRLVWHPFLQGHAAGGKDGPLPLFVIDGHEAKNIARAVIDGLSKVGFDNPAETHTRGKLEATERHLGDLRKLVFDSKGNPRE